MKIATCLIVLFLGVLIAAPLAPTAAAAECDAAPGQPDISVRIDAAPVVQDRSLSVAELSKIPSESRRAGMEAYDRTLGLTEANFNTDADLNLLTLPDAQGGFCTTARTVALTVKWKTTVHIAAQIKPGTCMDKVVGTHESKHVAIDATLRPIAKRAIELALTAASRHGASGRTIEESRDNLQSEMRAVVERAIDAFAVVRTRKQLALDNPEEYDKVSHTCGLLEYMLVLHEGDAGS